MRRKAIRPALVSPGVSGEVLPYQQPYLETVAISEVVYLQRLQGAL